MANRKTGWALNNLWLDLKLSSWLPFAIGALIVGGYLVVFNFGNAEISYLQRVVEVVIPLALGLHASFALAPENEPALELLLSYPYSLTRLLWRRLLIIGLLHGSIAFLASLLICAVWKEESLGLALVRWLAASIALCGISVFTTQLTRQAAFGAMLTTAVWASSLYGGDAIMRRWPWFWHFHIYLQPEKTILSIYLLNRLYFILAGSVLLLLASLLLQNDERTLGNR